MTVSKERFEIMIRLIKQASYIGFMSGFMYLLSTLATEAQEMAVLSMPAETVANPGQEVWIEIRIQGAVGLLGFSIVIDLPNTSPDYPLEYVTNSSSVAGTLCSGWMTVENDSSKKTGDRLSEAVLINGAGYLPIDGSGIIAKFNYVSNQMRPIKWFLYDSRSPVRKQPRSTMVIFL